MAAERHLTKLREKVWFHGSPRPRFDAFDPSVLGSGNDELGSGFYFTDSYATALGYAGPAGWVYETSLAIANPLTADADLPPAVIEALIREAPGFEEGLENWGETDFEGQQNVLRRACAAYVGQCRAIDGAFSALNALSGDFWGGHEAAFLEAAQRLTGYDGLVRRVGGETHAVAWSAASIVILDVRPSSRDQAPRFSV